MLSTDLKQHGCQSSPQGAHATRGIPDQRQSLVCSALTCALCKGPFLAPCFCSHSSFMLLGILVHKCTFGLPWTTTFPEKQQSHHPCHVTLRQVLVASLSEWKWELTVPHVKGQGTVPVLWPTHRDLLLAPRALRL